MEDSFKMTVVAQGKETGLDNVANKLERVAETGAAAEGVASQSKNMDFKFNTTSLTSTIKNLETLRTLLNSMKPGNYNIGNAIAALDESGILSTLPTGTQKMLQNFANLQGIANDPNQLKNYQIVLDAIIDSLKNADNIVKQTKDDTDAVGDEIKDNEGKQQGFNSELEKSPGLVQRLKQQFNALNVVQLVYLYRTVKRVATGLINAVQNAANYEESINLYTVALGDYVDQAVEWKDRISEALKLDPKEIMQYTGAFYNFAKGMGVTSDAAYTMATNLTQLTYDMASYLNISNEAANAKLLSAMAGQSRAVATVGVPTQIASLQELADNLDKVAEANDDLELAEEVRRLGIKKSVSDMTQTEKTYLRYIQIMRKTEKMQGDLGRTLITPANAIRMLQTQFNLLSQAVGQVLTPIIMTAMPYLIAFTNVLTTAAKKLAAFLGYELADIDYSKTFENLSADLIKTGKDAKGAGKKVKNGLAPFDELNQVISETSTAGGSGSGDDITGILEKYITGYDMLKELNTTLTDKAKALEGDMENVLKIALGMGSVLTIYKVVKGITNGVLGVAETGNKLKKIAGWFGIGGSKTGSEATKKVLDEAGKVGDQAKKSEKSISLPSFKTVAKGLGELAFVVTAVILYVEALGLFMKIPGVRENTLDGTWLLKEVFTGIAQIALPLAGVSAAVVVFSKIGLDTMTQGFLSLAEIIAGTEGIIVATGLIASIPGVDGVVANGIKLMKDVFNGIADVALPIGGVAVAMGALGALGIGTGGMSYAAVAAGFLGLAQIILATEQIVAAVGVISKIPGLTEIIDSGFDALNQLADGIGGMIGHFVGSIAEESLIKISESFPTLGTNLSEFSKNAGPFFTDIKGIDATAATGAKNLADTLLILSGTNLINGITGWLNFGKTSLKDFGEQLPEFGASMKSFSDAVAGINEKDVTSAANAGKALAEVVNALPTTGGVIAKYWLGEKNLSTFSLDLLPFGNAIAVFAKRVENVDTNAVTSAANAAKALAAVVNELPPTGSVIAKWWIGEKDLALFSENLPLLGFGMYGLYNYAKFIEGDKLEMIAKIAKELANFIDALPPQDGVAQWFSGQYKLTDFASDLIVFGGRFKTYYDKVSGTSYTTLSGVTDNIGSLVDAFALMKDKDLVPTMSAFGQALTTIGNDINNLKVTDDMSKSLTKFGESLGKKIKKGIQNSLQGKLTVKSLTGLFNESYDISLFASGGIPNSGDIFAMNENGRAEYMASIGNRTAVVNQDQMVQSLATVITNAMTSMGFGNSQKGDTIVYIGNDKVYQGQGEYQNRQADRWGTNVIKV